MWLERVSVHNCRIIKKATLSLSPKVNVIVGDNGSGKSSLLEALCTLSRGRSYRTSRIAEVINHQADSILCTSQLHYHQNDKSIPIGIEKSKQQTKIRINQQDVKSQATLSKALPITIIHPESVDLITGGPSVRRAFIDWIAFYLSADFYTLWKQYKHVLKQRNACLKNPKQRYALPYWTDQLIDMQSPLHEYRLQALETLSNNLLSYQSALWDGADVLLNISTGFSADTDIQDKDALKTIYAKREQYDLKSGTTFYGVHRSDLKILINGMLASQVVSRGQLKILSILLLIAQSASASTNEQEKGIIAIDDLTAELDDQNRHRLLDLLIKNQQQLVMTTTPQGMDGIDLSAIEKRMFHVKHGEFTETS